MLSDLIFTDEANATSPACRRVVKHVIDGEAVWMLGSKLIEFLLEQDVFFVHIGIDEAELGLVGTVTERRTRNLKHGGNTRSTSDHTKVARKTLVVVELALGTLDTDVVANLEQRNVTRDVTLLVRLQTRCQHDAI